MASIEAPYPAQIVGWVVWGKVKSLPWWPGQVMHPSKGPPEVRKMAAMKSNAGKLLVMFLGDNKYAFLPWGSVVDFTEYKERHSSTNYSSKYWKLGVEEAEELLARRAGLQPATDHEPVDFATKKTNFSNLAKAWSGGSGTVGRPQNSAGVTGRATERSKGSPVQSEHSKPVTGFPESKSGVSAAKSLHRTSGLASDDGRPKSIGGIMLEWAQYMPQVTAVRKGAELSPADDTLRFARLVARGEEMAEMATSNEQALQVLHSFALQRRLRGVDSLVHPAVIAVPPLDVSEPQPTTVQPPAGDEICRADSVSNAGEVKRSNGPATSGSRRSPLARGPAAPSGPALPVPRVVVQEVLIITNPAAVTVPGRILKALLGDYAAASATQVQTAVGAAAAAAAQLSASPIEAGGSGCELPADVIVSAASRCADEPLSGGAVSPVAATRLASPQPCTAQRTEPPATSPSVAGTANKGHLHQTPLETLNPAVAAMLATLQDNVLQIDVALRINGKLLPHLSTGLLRLNSSSQEIQHGVSCLTPGQPPAGNPLGSPSRPLESEKQSQQQQVALHPSAPGSAARDLPAAWTSGAVSCAAGYEATGVGHAAVQVTQEADNLHPRDHEKQLREAPCGSGAGAGDPLNGRSTAPATGTIEVTEAAILASSSEEHPEVPHRDTPLESMAAAATATVVASAMDMGGEKHVAESDMGDAAAAPVLCDSTCEKSAQLPNLPPSKGLDDDDIGLSASLDLSRSLSVWLRGEVRVTSWSVCGPRLVLVAVSADRKREGGHGGIKREARVLLAEAKDWRAASPGGLDDETANGSGGEQQLKRRLRSATSPPAPVSTQAHKSSPQPPQSRGAAAQQAKPLPQQEQQQQQGEGGKDLPQISTTGPAAAALMRSRLLQQKRQASAAEATAAVAAAGGGTGAGQHSGTDASRSASSAGGGGGFSGTEGRPSKKVKLVRFPAPPAGTSSSAAPCSASRVSTGDMTIVTMASVAATALMGGGAAPADAALTQQLTGAPSGRRRMSYNQLVSSGDDALEDGQRYGGRVSANTGYSCSSYDAEWEVSYPPWLPQPAQKGAFITVSHHLNKSSQSHHYHHHHHQGQKSDQAYGKHSNQHLHYQSSAPHAPNMRGSGAGTGMLQLAVSSQPSHTQFRQPNYNHSYNYQYHHSHSQHQHAPHSSQLLPSPVASSRYPSSSGARAVSRRSSGYESWHRDEQEDLSYPERRVDGWSFDAGIGMDEGAAAASIQGWPSAGMYGMNMMPATSARMVQSHVGPAGSAVADAGGMPTGTKACEQILLDIRVGDEADLEGPTDPRINANDAAVAITVHLQPRDSSTTTSTTTALFAPPAPQLPSVNYNLGNPSVNTPVPSRQPTGGTATAVNTLVGGMCVQHPRLGGVHMLPPMTPFAEQLSTAPISPAAAAASTTPFGPVAGAAAAAVTFGVSPFSGMPPEDFDLAVVAAILADRHMHMCESAALNSCGASEADRLGQKQCELDAMIDYSVVPPANYDGVGSVDSLCEGEVARLRQECDTLREQVKLRLAPGAVDPLPQHQLPYTELVARVSERILALALQLPSLSGAIKQAFIQYSRTLMQEAAACSQQQQQKHRQQQPTTTTSSSAGTAVANHGEGISGGAADANSAEAEAPPSSVTSKLSMSSGRSLAVARVAADLVRSAAAPGLPLHPEDRWAFINLAAELLRP